MIKRDDLKATFTVTVPVKFTFVEDARLSGEDLFNKAVQYGYINLSKGNFDVLENETTIIKKDTHYTKEEREYLDNFWDNLTKGLI